MYMSGRSEAIECRCWLQIMGRMAFFASSLSLLLTQLLNNQGIICVISFLITSRCRKGMSSKVSEISFVTLRLFWVCLIVSSIALCTLLILSGVTTAVLRTLRIGLESQTRVVYSIYHFEYCCFSFWEQKRIIFQLSLSNECFIYL